MDLLQVIVAILLFGLLGIAVNWAASQWSIPTQIRYIIMGVIGVLFLLWIVSALGVSDLFYIDMNRAD